MNIRHLQYSIEFSHILTFQNHYREKIAPFFKTPNLRYAIENVNTIEESIKLVFMDANYVIRCSKSAVIMMFEGNPEELLSKGSVPFSMFSDIVGAIKEIYGFGYFTRHTIQCEAVSVFEKDDQIPIELTNADESNYLRFTPLDKTDEFTLVYEQNDSDKTRKVQIGNFSFKDIERLDLSPFRTEYNRDLFSGNKGYLTTVHASEPTTGYGRQKFRDLLMDVISIIEKSK